MKEILRLIINEMGKNSSMRFKVGMILLVINPIIGVIVSPLLIITFANIFNLKTGTFIGVIAYILSWALLGIGIILAGKEGYQISKKLLREIKKIIFKKKYHG